MHVVRQGIRVHGVTISAAQYEWRVSGSLKPASAIWSDDRVARRSRSARPRRRVSIEMFEAVGERYGATYFNVLRRMLVPGGRALVQSITIDDARFAGHRVIERLYSRVIFPGGMLPSTERLRAVAKRAGLEATLSLSFGTRLCDTLRHWSALFEAQLDRCGCLDSMYCCADLAVIFSLFAKRGSKSGVRMSCILFCRVIAPGRGGNLLCFLCFAGC